MTREETTTRDEYTFTSKELVDLVDLVKYNCRMSAYLHHTECEYPHMSGVPHPNASPLVASLQKYEHEVHIIREQLRVYGELYNAVTPRSRSETQNTPHEQIH